MIYDEKDQMYKNCAMYNHTFGSVPDAPKVIIIGSFHIQRGVSRYQCYWFPLSFVDNFSIFMREKEENMKLLSH